MILRGGYTNDGKVVRVGETVRRPWRATSPSTAALLTHLERVGFDGAPRFLGRDEEGRETLSFIAGEAAIEPQQPWALTDEALTSVARLLRAFHDAVATFDPSAHTWPEAVPERFRDGTISHNDPNLDNVVFRDGEAVALIDFDIAKTASRVEEMFNAMLYWAPLGDPADADPPLRGVDVPRRCRILADVYEMSGVDRSRLVEVAVLRTRRSWSRCGRSLWRRAAAGRACGGRASATGSSGARRGSTATARPSRRP